MNTEHSEMKNHRNLCSEKLESVVERGSCQGSGSERKKIKTKPNACFGKGMAGRSFVYTASKQEKSRSIN